MIRPNDRLYVDFANTAGRAVDLNLLYVDHGYGITLLCAAHLAQGDSCSSRSPTSTSAMRAASG